MKGCQIALGLWRGRKAAAKIVDGRLADLLVDPPDGGPPRPGTLFSAVAGRPMKGQGGVIVQLPDGASGFLRQAGDARPGKPVVVQVSGFAEPGKAMPLTTKLLFKGRYVILTPGAPVVNVSRQIAEPALRDALKAAASGAVSGRYGLIVRSAATLVDDGGLADEVTALCDLADRVLGAASPVPPQRLLDGPDAHARAATEWEPGDAAMHHKDAFAELGVDQMIEDMRAPYVELPAGGSAFVEPTRALVAVDVNTGNDTSPAAGLKANIALARDLPRQLRCRGLGGQITIDLAPMPKRDRRQFETVLRNAFRKDDTETALVGWTPLGHYELQRKRDRLPLD